MTLLASFPDIPKPACADRFGLGLVFHGKGFLSSALLILFGEHNRNTLKDTYVPTVPATRSGQDHFFIYGIRQGPDPDGWETGESDNMIWKRKVIMTT